MNRNLCVEVALLKECSLERQVSTLEDRLDNVKEALVQDAVPLVSEEQVLVGDVVTSTNE